MPHAITVGHLVKPVTRGDRADLHRLKQNVVTGISGHRVFRIFGLL
jgi:hypothetical protein